MRFFIYIFPQKKKKKKNRKYNLKKKDGIIKKKFIIILHIFFFPKKINDRFFRNIKFCLNKFLFKSHKNSSEIKILKK